ncbi:hypothetical protein AXE65_05215 [Ventosimonas gracilis]|uniref:Outer membrane lipoprotein carrier protein LolA n=1 Tax=Ventosimonas gracilis TaxID=1680762 RepID=A0A139SNY4_9GAMM|nr:outer membrane lipoprotein carrier protein LolA [Ventosimonas gracilis]KXU36288.1 hypothetical protein AXE65_05215 [Ventosimonas gracilis]
MILSFTKSPEGFGRGLVLLCLLLVSSWPALAFDLSDLQQKLQQTPVVRGDFSQEKYIAGLPIPLVGLGQFCFSNKHGILWDLTVPIKQRLRITKDGLALETQDGKWQLQAGQDSRQTRLFLDVLQGDTDELHKQFQLALNGNSEDWQLTLTPKTALLKQIFTRIQINGGALLSKVELFETSGERTVIRLQNSKADTRLTAEEARLFE